MFEGIPFENTPDFEYVFEDVVKLPEFDLYHIGLGIYRFGKPVICSNGCFEELKEKYSMLIFCYIDIDQEREESQGKPLKFPIDRTEHTLKLLFVTSKMYSRISDDCYVGDLIKSNQYKELFPEGYDSDIDYLRSERVLRDSELWENNQDDDLYTPYLASTRLHAVDFDRTNMLLGFRWIPSQYYDEDGRVRYMMLEGYVAKRISEGIYAFDGKISTDNSVAVSYPCVNEGTLSDNGIDKCAVVGKPEETEGSLVFYFGTAARYAAFDDAGIRLLKKFYEYTVGYEYKELDIMHQATLEEIRRIREEMSERKKELKNSFQVGTRAAELVKGIGYRDITIHYRVLFDSRDIRLSHSEMRYDFTYLEDGFLKLVDCFYNKIYSIPTGVIAELYVEREMEIYPGIRENILEKVIDNTWFEKNSVGIGQYAQFKDFAAHKYNSEWE